MLYSVTFPNIPILQTIFPCHELGYYIFPKIKKKICIQPDACLGFGKWSWHFKRLQIPKVMIQIQSIDSS